MSVKSPSLVKIKLRIAQFKEFSVENVPLKRLDMRVQGERSQRSLGVTHDLI